ncbi:MAG: hypothetical protein PGN34_20370 [Methylobacterium frigidaeris]
MAHALARCLPDFSGDLPALMAGPEPLGLLLRPARRAAPPAEAASAAVAVAPAPARAAILTAEEREALLREGEERGRRAALAEAQAALAAAGEAAEARLAAERAAFAERLEAERRSWGEAQADPLAAGLSAALGDIETRLADRVAEALVPVLDAVLRRQAADELRAVLARLMADPDHPAIRVAGPEDLLTALAARLGPEAGAVTFVPGDGVEVRVTADRTVIETQLAAWGRRLAAAVEEA